MPTAEVSEAQAPGAFTRWPGLLRLTLGWLVAPIVALANQQLTYTANIWACGQGFHAVIHIVPLLCLIVALGAGLTSYQDWIAVGRGVEDEAATVESRSRFIALLGLAFAAFSALVILTQWLAVFVFDPCMRA